MYPVVFFDALRVKIRDEATVRSKAIYLALAVLPDGNRDILGLWIEQTEGAKFWMKVFTDLKTRGCQDILIAVTDGLKGMGEALAAIYPATTLQTCIVHLIRHSLEFANWKERKPMAAALRPIYTAPSAEAASAALDAFERGPMGHASFRPWSPPGAARGRKSFRSLRSHPRSAGDLHDQRARKRARAAPEDHQDARPLSQRRCRDETDLARAAQHHREMGARRRCTGKPAMNQFAILYEDRFSPSNA